MILTNPRGYIRIKFCGWVSEHMRLTQWFEVPRFLLETEMGRSLNVWESYLLISNDDRHIIITWWSERLRLVIITDLTSCKRRPTFRCHLRFHWPTCPHYLSIRSMTISRFHFWPQDLACGYSISIGYSHLLIIGLDSLIGFSISDSVKSILLRSGLNHGALSVIVLGGILLIPEIPRSRMSCISAASICHELPCIVQLFALFRCCHILRRRFKDQALALWDPKEKLWRLQCCPRVEIRRNLMDVTLCVLGGGLWALRRWGIRSCLLLGQDVILLGSDIRGRLLNQFIDLNELPVILGASIIDAGSLNSVPASTADHRLSLLYGYNISCLSISLNKRCFLIIRSCSLNRVVVIWNNCFLCLWLGLIHCY